MFKSFKVIDDFILDIYGCHLLCDPIDPKIEELKKAELKNAYKTMIAVIGAGRTPSHTEFMRDVYPLLEIAVHWDALKKEKRLTEAFIKHARNGLHHTENFYGTTFELDMASRCLLSGWPVEYVEDPSGKGGRQIDFIFRKDKKAIGVECYSKRYTSIYSPEKMKPDNIENDLQEHAKKFTPELAAKLGLDEKLVVVELTRKDYSLPDKLLTELEKRPVPSDLDALVYTWRQDINEGENHSLRVGYRSVGNASQAYFTTTYAAEFRGGAFFMRKYVEPEPTWGTWGPEESISE